MFDLSALDDAHLRALSRALHEARFCQETHDPVVWASPLVIDLHVWTLQEQRRRDAAARSTTNWDGWLTWSGRDENRTVVRRLSEDPKLLGLVTGDPNLLREILRPFEVSDADLTYMIDAARAVE